MWSSQTLTASSICCESLLVETGSWRKERLFQDELSGSTKIIKEQFEIIFVNHKNLRFKSKNTSVELEMSITGGCYTRQPKQSRWTMI